MKCDQCGGVAVIGMPQHRLNLCTEHYVPWVQDTVARTMARYEMLRPGERVLVAVSGGKDSLALWDILLALGYVAEGLYIHLGIAHESYSDHSQERAAAFAAERGGLPLHIVNLQAEYGLGAPELIRRWGGRRVCASCGLAKRHIMNRVAREGDFAALATGHNLDDEAALLLQNNLHWHLGYLSRQAPVLEADRPGLARKIKPLVHLYERETAAYALVRGIEFVEQECPYSVKARLLYYKGILNQMERRSPGTKLQYYRHFIQAKQAGQCHFDALAPEFSVCPRCGQTTTSPGPCAFCRLVDESRA